MNINSVITRPSHGDVVLLPPDTGHEKLNPSTHTLEVRKGQSANGNGVGRCGKGMYGSLIRKSHHHFRGLHTRAAGGAS
jgi:hypothetical protein